MRVSGSVSPSALIHNLTVAKEYAPNSRVMAVIKSNAYGHGLIPVANVLEGRVDAFAVATIQEALELRHTGISIPICVLSGFYSADDVAALVKHDISVTVHCDEQITTVNQSDAARPLSVWLKVNTGMNRLGFAPESIKSVFHRLESSSRVSVAGVMSHLACADDVDSRSTDLQINRFVETAGNLNTPLSLANSAGVLKWPLSHLDWIRPGIMLYGASPILDTCGTDFGLRPAMNVFATVIAVNHLAKGESVGYGLAWKSPRNTKIGIVACGYGDGYPRLVSRGAQVLAKGVRTDVIGRVSMDTLAIDLADIPQLKVGSRVQLFGEGLPVEEIAAVANTIAYDILCSINPRVIPMNLRSD